MANCVLCGNQAGALAHKCRSGAICKACNKKIPSFIKASQMDADDIMRFFDYENKDIIKKFNYSSNLGRLYIDEAHGLFAISDNIKTDMPCVFHVSDIEAVALYCTDVKSQRENIYCDVELSAEIRNPHMSFKVKILTNEKCAYTRIDATHVEWKEPPVISMFRDMFNQMVKNELSSVKAIIDAFESKEIMEIIVARSMFNLPEDYTMEELEKHKDITMNAFSNNKAVLDNLQIAYDTLMQYHKG